VWFLHPSRKGRRAYVRAYGLRRDAASVIFNLPSYRVVDAVDLPLGGCWVKVVPVGRSAGGSDSWGGLESSDSLIGARCPTNTGVSLNAKWSAKQGERHEIRRTIKQSSHWRTSGSTLMDISASIRLRLESTRDKLLLEASTSFLECAIQKPEE
jgi:hypothetical protein